MLALGSALYMVALAIAQAVIALHGHALVALGWGVGVVTFVLVTVAELATTCSGGSSSAWWSSSFAALLSFAVALRCAAAQRRRCRRAIR